MEPQNSPASFIGTKAEIFVLGLKTGFLTLVTLGIYRFWAKTRLRRHVWSATQLQGLGFEYTGTGMEKFLGFLTALVILVVYLGSLNLVLFLFGLRFIHEPDTLPEVAMQLSLTFLNFFALLPLIFFAQYRAMRYKLARTRFRGIRFGMASAAGGYVWRALLLTLVTVISLGTLYPLMAFRLDKYMTDRAFFGDARFEQAGKWTALYRFLIPAAVGVALFGLGAFVGSQEREGIAVALTFSGGLLFYAGLVYYQVHSAAYLMSNRVLGGQVRFDAKPSVRSIIGIILLGGLGVGVVAMVLFGVLAGLFFGMTKATMSVETGLQGMFVVLAIIYLVALVVIAAVSLALITQPLLKHLIGTITVLNAGALDQIQQRAADRGADAEGFADALDVGSAF